MEEPIKEGRDRGRVPEELAPVVHRSIRREERSGRSFILQASRPQLMRCDGVVT
jgi:hypothetical protein